MIYADRLISYLDVVKTFKKGSILTSWEQRKIQDQTDELVKILEFLLWDLAKESTNEPPRNSSFYKKIKELSDCFNTIPLICSTGENLTFSELGEYLEVINSNFESIDIEIYFEIESDKEHIEKLIFTISHDLMSYLRKLKCWWFLCQKTKIITPLQMRWSLVNKFHGRHLTIPISGSKRCGVWKPPQLDAYLLPWKYSILSWSNWINDSMNRNMAERIPHYCELWSIAKTCWLGNWAWKDYLIQPFSCIFGWRK